MVRIVRPEGQPQQGRASINQSLAATAGSGLGALGSAVAAAGRAVQQLDPGAGSRKIGKMAEVESKKYFDETKRAHQSAMLSNSMNDATLEFMKAQQQRVSQVQDDKGNPTFMSLTDDIGQLGKDTADRISKNISDPEVAAAFKAKFQNYTSKQQVLSLKTARTQQVGFARASLDKGLGGLAIQGTSDDLANLESYIGQGHQQLNEALQSGAISPEEHQNRLEDFVLTTRSGAYENVIDQDTTAASALLSQNAESLGITEKARDQLNRTLDAKIRADEIEAKKAAATLQREHKNQQALLIQDAELRMETDSLREDDLLKMEDQLDPLAFGKLKLKFVKHARQSAKTNAKMSQVSDLISSGGSTDGVSPKTVDEHYKRMTESQQLATGKAPGLPQRAQIAASYNGKVRGFAKEVSQSLLSGDPASAAEAVSAYTYIRDRDSKALDGNIFTNKAEAVAEYAELLSERGGMKLEDAVQVAKEAVLTADDPIQKERNKQFRKIKDFKLDRLEETTADDLDAENFFGVNKAVSTDSQMTYRRFVQEAYVATGDEDAARKIAKNKMDKTHAVSAFNGDEQYMFAPPSKLFPNIPEQALRSQMEEQMIPFIPQGLEGKDMMIFSDRTTLGTKVTLRNTETGAIIHKEVPSYGIQYMKEIAPGVMVATPLVDPKTGSLVRWYPEEGEAKQRLMKEREEGRAAKGSSAVEADKIKRAQQKLGVDEAGHTLFGVTTK